MNAILEFITGTGRLNLTDPFRFRRPAPAPVPEPDVRFADVPPRGGPVVLQVLPSLVTGGAERGCVDVAAALARAGGTPLVASSGGPMARELERWKVPHFTLPLASKNPLVMRRNVDRLAAIVERWGVQVVHARSRAPAWSALAACRRTGARFMTTFHAPYNFSNELKRRYNSVMARGERVIAISEFVARHVAETYGVGPDRLRLVHRGIDFNHFAPERVSAERMIRLANAWRVPEELPVVMLPGRLTRWKGQEVLIDALAKLGRRDLRCLLVGSDQGRSGYRRELERRIAERGLSGIVHIADHCDDMAAAYRLANVVVSASIEPEAFGRVIVEAQAMGRPLIVTGHGAVRETVVPGETAWVVPPGDPDTLAATLAVALELRDEDLAAMAERQIAFVRGRYGRERMCAETLAIYGELVAADDGA